MKYYFIVNPGSRTGHGRELWDSLEEKIIERKIDYEVFFTEGEGDATKLAQKVCREHPEMKRVVIAGGDGTANEAVNGLENYDSIILGYIPTGSSNDLARGLGIDQDLETAAERVLRPKMFKDIDHGYVEFLDESALQEGRKFAVSSGFGYDAAICCEAEKSKLKKVLNKLHIGKLVYYLLGFKLIFTSPRAKVKIIIDGEQTLTYDNMLFAAAMNTKYEGGGMPMNPSADPTDGKVSMCVIHDISRLKHLLLMGSIIKGKHVKYKGVEQITCKSFEIESDRPLVVHTDGEVMGKHMHIKYSCLPKKIKMML